MVANYSFDVTNIDILAPAFFKHNNSVIATVPYLSILSALKISNPLKNAYVISEWAQSYAYGELWKVIEFEKMLANISVPEVERIDTSAIYHKTTIKGTHK